MCLYNLRKLFVLNFRIICSLRKCATPLRQNHSHIHRICYRTEDTVSALLQIMHTVSASITKPITLLTLVTKPITNLIIGTQLNKFCSIMIRQAKIVLYLILGTGYFLYIFHIIFNVNGHHIHLNLRCSNTRYKADA